MSRTLVFLAIHAPLLQAAVVINEVAPKSAGGVCNGADWVELFNNGNAEAIIASYKLCDRQGCAHNDAFTFAAGAKIAAKGYLVVCSNKTSVSGFNFAVQADDSITLQDAGGKNASTSGALTGRIDGKTWARLTDNTFAYVATATPGAINNQVIAAVLAGTVVINEVASSGAGGACKGKDWIELFNKADSEADIASYKLCDNKGCLNKEAYTFPAGSKIGAKGYLLVCKSNTSSGFSFGIRQDDTLMLQDAGGSTTSSSGRMTHRSDAKTWARLSNGSYAFVQSATPGGLNDETPASFSCTKGMPCWDLFDQQKLRSVNVDITVANIAKMDESPKKEVMVPCVVTINYGTPEAEVFPYAGCRFKGSVGAWGGCINPDLPDRGLLKNPSAVCRKMHFKADANYFNQSAPATFHGLKKLQMHSMHADSSLMLERMAYNLMQRAGFFTSRAMHTRVSINGKFDGVSLLVEQVDSEFLKHRLPNQIIKAGSLYKELSVQGCVDKPPTKTCKNHMQPQECMACSYCEKGNCDMKLCWEGQCINGMLDARCAGQADMARTASMKSSNDTAVNTGFCNGGRIMNMCPDPDIKTVDCRAKARKEGTINHVDLMAAVDKESRACVKSGAACTPAAARAILVKYFNMSAMIDALVANQLDFDQFTTFYGGDAGGHNFYTFLTNKITMIPWDFDRGMAVCRTRTCPGGGALGDLTFEGQPKISDGFLGSQRITPWGRCYMPPWFADMTSDPKLNEQFCVKGITTFAPHVHASCNAVINLVGRAYKSEYAARLKRFWQGGSAWADAAIDVFKAQIQASVIEAASAGGFPKLKDWTTAVASAKTRVADIIKVGGQLEAAATLAQKGETPAKSAVSCYLPKCSGDYCMSPEANGGNKGCWIFKVDNMKTQVELAMIGARCGGGRVPELTGSDLEYPPGGGKFYMQYTCCSQIAEKTQTGSLSMQMSEEQAKALAKDPKAKEVFQKAIASTIGFRNDEITITAIYINGVKAGERRLADAATLRVDYVIKSTETMDPATMNLAMLKTNVQNEAKAVGQTVVITSTPTVGSPPKVQTQNDPSSTSAANSSWKVVKLVLFSLLLPFSGM